MSRFAISTASFREKTEDRAAVFSIGGGWVVCVADGTGGISGAATAADMFIAGVSRAIDTHTIDLSDDSSWVALLTALDNEIEGSALAGETTGVALAVTPVSLVGASVGDSRAWLFADTAVELTKNQNRKPRLGTGQALPTPFTAAPRGTLVVGTDGLFDYATIDAIRAVAGIASPETAHALANLPRAARSRALADDVAVVVGWLDEPEPHTRIR